MNYPKLDAKNWHFIPKLDAKNKNFVIILYDNIVGNILQREEVCSAKVFMPCGTMTCHLSFFIEMCPGTAVVGYAVALGEGHSSSHSII